MASNTMNPDQTTLKGAVCSRSILFVIYNIEVDKQRREQTTIFNCSNSGKRVYVTLEGI